MTNLIENAVYSVDKHATLEQQGREIIIVSPWINEIMENLLQIKEDCWIASRNSIIINRR
jgi:hypothetical protein